MILHSVLYVDHAVVSTLPYLRQHCDGYVGVPSSEWVLGAVEQARSISWTDCVKDDLNQAVVLLVLGLHILVVISNCCVVIWL